MDLEFELVPYSDELRDAYLALLPEQEVEVARGKLEWKFRGNPHGSGLVAVAREGERILGLNAFMAGDFKLGERQVRGYQSMDTIVSPAARGKGVFGRLINLFYEQTGGAPLYGFPNENSAHAFFGKLGWSRFGPVPMLVRPLRTGYFTKRIAAFLPDLPVPLFSRRMKNALPFDRFDAEATEVWRRFSSPITCAIERDADYLNWRFADHPTERYTMLRASGGSFVVGNVAAKHGARIGYLMEAIGEEGELAPLIAQAVHRMRVEGADLAFAWCLPWSPNYRAYRKAGFYPFPPRFRPIIINFGARPGAEENSPMGCESNWYISYVDSDTA